MTKSLGHTWPPALRLRALVLISALLGGLWASPAAAVPAFAAQTGQPCQACHVGGFGPQLTPFGRSFKLHGYTARSGGFTTPFAAMAVASYLRTAKAQPPADGYKANDNFALDQVSLFFAGGLGSHLGAFVQTTYDGIAKAWAWDNVDLRATTDVQVHDADVLLGLSLNNSPTNQDVWNTLPAWGFPYTGSGLAPSPAAAPLLSGALAQTSLGLTGYAWINSTYYVEAGAYGSPSSRNLTHLGADPFAPGDIHGLAPYGRIAVQNSLGGATVQAGLFGMRADIYPERDRSAGATDRYSDLGLDVSYQRTLDNSDVFSLNGRVLRETQNLAASQALGLSDNSRNTLTDLRADASYYWRNRYGVTLQAFDTWGSADPVLYTGRTGKPDSSGLSLQLDGTLFGGADSPMGPRFNVRAGVQYTMYDRFDGARSNYDGAGGEASDNNTLRVFTWFAY